MSIQPSNSAEKRNRWKSIMSTIIGSPTNINYRVTNHLDEAVELTVYIDFSDQDQLKTFSQTTELNGNVTVGGAGLGGHINRSSSAEYIVSDGSRRKIIHKFELAPKSATDPQVDYKKFFIQIEFKNKKIYTREVVLSGERGFHIYERHEMIHPTPPTTPRLHASASTTTPPVATTTAPPTATLRSASTCSSARRVIRRGNAPTTPPPYEKPT